MTFFLEAPFASAKRAVAEGATLAWGTTKAEVMEKMEKKIANFIVEINDTVLLQCNKGLSECSDETEQEQQYGR